VIEKPLAFGINVTSTDIGSTSPHGR
jgi:hypothetical protein